MSTLLQQFGKEVCPKALDVIGEFPIDTVKKGSFEHNGTTYDVITQNKLKESKFALLAKNGNNVAWIIDHDSQIWYLMVNGNLIEKSDVTDEGELGA